MNIPNVSRQIVGGAESQVVVGVGAFAVQNGMRAFALTVRTQGTIIAAITVQDQDGAARAYVPTWLGIALNQGDYFVSLSPITNITLTAAADSVTLHCDRNF
jgi:hypothetical protein